MGCVRSGECRRKRGKKGCSQLCVAAVTAGLEGQSLPLAGAPAAVGGVEYLLVAKPVFGRGGKGRFAANRQSKGIELARVGEAVADLFFLDDTRVGARAKIDGDGTLDIEAVESGEDTVLASEFEQCTVLGASGDADGSDRLAGELKGKSSGAFDSAGAFVLDGCTGHGRDFVVEDETERVDAMHADVRDGAAGCERRVRDPRAGAFGSGITKFGASEYGAPDVVVRDAVTQSPGAVFETEDMGHAERKRGGLGGNDHLFNFGGIHRHGLFAEHGLPGSERSEDIAEVEGIRGGDEDGVNIGATGEVFGGGELVRDPELLARFPGFRGVTA